MSGKATTTAASAALAILLTIGVPAMSAASTFVYVSDAEDSTIDAYVMDLKTGALTSIGKAEAGKTEMPMAVAPNKKFLYAVVRSQPMRVITYAIDGKTGALTQKATAPLPDSMPYVSTDRSGRFLLTASYGGDKIAVSPIGADGLVTAEAIQVLPTGRNAHSILADRTNHFVYSANLGANQVLQFAFDAKTGKLAPLDPPAVKPEPGHGPRHLAFSLDNKFLYVLNELSGHVTQYAIDGKKGTLKLVDSVPSVPPELGMKWGQPQAPATPAAAPKPDEKPPIWAADLRFTPNGKFLYTTERNTDKIALFTVAAHWQTHLRHQFCHRATATRHQYRSERALSRRFGRKIGSALGLSDRSSERQARRTDPLSGGKGRQLDRDRRREVSGGIAVDPRTGRIVPLSVIAALRGLVAEIKVGT
jgi:6-phosphogluconolactonase